MWSVTANHRHAWINMQNFSKKSSIGICLSFVIFFWFLSIDIIRPLRFTENNIEKKIVISKRVISDNYTTIDDVLSESKSEFNFTSSKKILYFNNYFHLKDWRFGFGNQPFLSNKCPEQNCFVTKDRALLSSLAEFDAILFHARDRNFQQVLQVGSAFCI